MSYCRFSEESDVYVFGSVSGFLECCGCHLYKYSYQTKKYGQMIKHLQEHVSKGFKVPEYAFQRLHEEQTEGGGTFILKNPPKEKIKSKNVRKTENEILELQFYRAMMPIRKEVAAKTLALFESIYNRKPTKLELDGMAKAADITLDLVFGQLTQ